MGPDVRLERPGEGNDPNGPFEGCEIELDPFLANNSGTAGSDDLFDSEW